MTREVRVLRVGWERLRRALGGPLPEHLEELAMARGSALLGDGPPARVDGSMERVDALRSQVVFRAAAASAFRQRLLAERDRLARAKDRERRTYEDGLVLDRDRVPPLKLRAKALRAEIRRLEAEARARGLDPEAIEPIVDWPETLGVDAFEPPRYASVADRKRAALEYFRRLG